MRLLYLEMTRLTPLIKLTTLSFSLLCVATAASAQVRATSFGNTDPEALCIRSDGLIGYDAALVDTCEPDVQIIPLAGLSFGSAGQTVIDGGSGDVTVGGALAIVNGSTIDAGNNRIQNVAVPTAAADAANKQYVDDQNGAQDTRITGVENTNTIQQIQINSNTNRISNVESNNATQQGQINSNTSRISNVENTNTVQQTQINSNTNRISNVESDNAAQQSQINSNTTNITNLQAVSAELQTQVSANSNDILGLQADVDSLQRRDEELAEGIAISLALDAPQLRSGQTFAMRGGWGNFNGSNAAGITAAGALSQNVVVDAGVGWGASQGTVAGKAGVTVGW